MRLIDSDRYIEEHSIDGWLDDISVEQFNILNPTVKAIPEAIYEKRLKADMGAMLTELQLEIEDMPHYIVEHMKGAYINYNDTLQVIQQKINALKGDQEGEE